MWARSVSGGGATTSINVTSAGAVFNYSGSSLLFNQKSTTIGQGINVVGGTFNSSATSTVLGAYGSPTIFGTINVSAGIYNNTAASASTINLGGTGGTGGTGSIVLQNGGVFNDNGTSAAVALGLGSAGIGIVNVSSGTFSLNGTSSSLLIADGKAAVGTVIVSGTFNQTGVSSALTVAAVNGSTGTLNISGGTYNYGGNNFNVGTNGLANNVSTGNVIVGAGGTLNVTGSTNIFLANGPYTAGKLTLNGTGVLSAPTATLIVGQYDGSNASTGTLATGTFTMNASSSATVGRILLGGGFASSAVNGIVNLNGATLTTGGVAVNPNGTALTASATALAFNANGGTVVASYNSSTNASFFNGVYADLLAGGLTFNTASYAVNITGSMHGSGAFTKVGTGALTLSGGSNYTGGTLINQGTVIGGNQGGLGSGPVTLANAAGVLLQVNSNNGALQVQSLSGGGALGGNVDLNAQTLFVATGSTTAATFAGTIYDSGTGGQVGKYFAGSQAFTGNNTYAGPTSVVGGTLLANAPQVIAGGTLVSSATGTGTVTITSGGTLGGNGGTGAVVINSGGTITGGPDGVTPGTLTTAGQTWNAGGAFAVKVSGDSSANDQLVMSGLTIAATNASSGGTPFTVAVTGLGSSASVITSTGIVLAIDNTGSSAANGVFQSAINAAALVLTTTNVATPSGYAPQLAELDTGTSQELVLDDPVAATPEPTSLMLACLAAAPLALGRRRRPSRQGRRA
jgi:fibronectin-binding autotransporter adhesin